MRTICRKTVSWLLTLTMVLAFIPTVGITAMATEDENPATIYEVENDAQETPGNVTDGAIYNQDEPQEEPQDEPQNEPANEEQGEGENEGFPMIRMMMASSLLRSAPQLDAPQFSVQAGTYNSAQSVTLTCNGNSDVVSIYYTLNDTEPTSASTVYRGPINITESTTIKAIAMADGIPSSDVVTAAYVINIPSSGIIANGGYPYGASMSSSNVTLKLAVESGATATYQWQKATSSAIEPADSAFANVAGATSASFALTPESGAWYRCVLNGSEKSKAVRLVKPGSDGRTWTNSMGGSWYISNGTMAYAYNGSKFDVTGLFSKGGTNYMLQTVYSGEGWEMRTDTAATPNATDNQESNAQLDDMLFAFSTSDDYALYITADLKAGQQSFSFGSDTQLGDDSTSGGYYDCAALVATQNSDQSLHHVAMIGAASEAAAKDDDPAFVITPITEKPVFWIGHWNNREHFGFNNSGVTGPVYANGKGSATGTVRVEGDDSGMTMSWLNVPSGGQVKFLFSVGDVAATGAVKSGINYQTEEITGLDANTNYIISVINEDGSSGESFKVKSSGRGTVPFVGESIDVPSKSYDFAGKTISIAKEGSNDAANQETIGGRPDVETLNTIDDNDVAKPISIRANEVSVGPRAITVQLNPADTTKMSQEYCLVDEDGNEVSYTSEPAKGGNGWTKPSADGKMVFSGLNPETHYVLKSRVPANSLRPASVIVTAAAVTPKDVTIDVPTNDETTFPYDGEEHSFPINVSGGANPQVTYSTGISTQYSEDVPSFKAGGQYKVYYKITQDDTETIYGNYTITINPRVTFNLNGGDELELAAIGGNVSSATSNAVTVKYGMAPNSLTVQAAKNEVPNFFAGWYNDSKLKNLFWFQNDFRNAPAIVSDMTLYAKWTQDFSSVVGHTDSNADRVQLQKGGVPVPNASWIPVDGNGNFTISNVPDDEYNLVMKKGSGNGEQTITARVRVKDNEIIFIDGDAAFPGQKISSTVTVATGAPSVVVAGLERETLATSGAGLRHWDFTNELNPYAILELKFDNSEDITDISLNDANNHLTAAEQAVHTAQTAIASEAGAGTQVEFFDISVIRSDYENNVLYETVNISELQVVLEIAVPFTPDDGQEVSKVYRYHDNVAQEFARLNERPTVAAEYADGTFYVGDGVVYIYTDKFSTYAIGTIAQRGSSRAATFKNVVKETTNGTYKLSDNNPIANQLVTITPQPNEGYVVGKITVTDAKGNIVKLTDNGNGTYSFRQPDGAVTIDIQFVTEVVAALTVSYDVCTEGNDCPIWPFTDAKSTAWYHNGVHWAIDNGIMKGYNETQFGPNDETTRAQVATILYRLAGSPAATKENGFADVKADQWYTDAINWAAETGVVTGWTRNSDGAEVFDPNAPVTREQLAAMIYRFAKLNGKGFEGLWAFNLDYKDAESVSEWANEAVCWMTMQGVITGIGGDLIDPQADASRAQVATMFMRYCEDAAK